MTAAKQLSIKVPDRGWNRSMALPKRKQAIQYRKILRDLGNQTCAPLETADGYVVRWRAKKQKAVKRSELDLVCCHEQKRDL